MNYNICAYAVFIVTIVFIIVYVGRLFHTNGRVFILNLFRGAADKTDHLNNILLLAYYLFNIGYAFVTLRFWEKVLTLSQMCSSLAQHLGFLLFILAVTHYFNLYLVYRLSKQKHSFL